MTIGQALFSFRGRMSRRDYWRKGFPVLLPLVILNSILAYGVGNDRARALATIACIWLGLALVVKRLHDRNRSGWFAATLLIPLANIVFGIRILIEVCFLRGTIGANLFGDDPVQDLTLNGSAIKRAKAGSFEVTGLWLVLIALLMFSALLLLWRWDSALNRGHTFGYYGQYNMVSNALAKLPDVRVLSGGHNHDITLEEFHFDIRTSEGRDIVIWFNEDNPVRKMSGQELSQALTNMIQDALIRPFRPGISGWIEAGK